MRFRANASISSLQTGALVELKATTRTDPMLEAKVISYLRTTGLRLGIVLNFNCQTLKEGIKRIVV